MTTRRHILLLIGVVTACIPPRAWTQPVRLQKVGILSPGRQADMACESNELGHNAGCFVEGLRSLGYGEGRNVAFEYRFAEEASERLPTLAAELVSLRPDVIFTFTSGGAVAAAGATSTIPIVVGPAGERTLERLAGNLARPVGNVTGFTLESLGQEEKCLQLLKELAPRTSRVAVLVNPDNPNYRSYPDTLRSAANQLGLTLVKVEARNDSDLPRAFATIRANGADAIYIVDDAALAGTAEVRKQVIKWAMRWPLTGGIFQLAGRARWWTRVFWHRQFGAFSACRVVRSPHPGWGQAWRSPSRAPDDLQAIAESQDCRCPGTHHPAIPVAARGRGDRVVAFDTSQVPVSATSGRSRHVAESRRSAVRGQGLQ